MDAQTSSTNGDLFCGLDSISPPHSITEGENEDKERLYPPASSSTEFLPPDVLSVINNLLSPHENTDYVILSDSDDEAGDTACSIRGCTNKRNVSVRSRIINNLYSLTSNDNPLCSKCFEEGKKGFENMLSCDMDKFKFPVATEKEEKSIITIDGDEKDTSPLLEYPEMLEWSKNVDSCIENIAEDLNIKQKHDAAVDKVEKKIEELSSKFSVLSDALSKMDRDLVSSVQELYQACKPPTREVCLNLDSDDPDKVQKTVVSTPVPVKPPGLPPRGKLERKKPTINQKVFVVKVSEFSDWVPAVVEHIYIRDSGIEGDRKTVRYKVRIQGSVGGSYTKEVTDEHLAYKDPSPVRLIIGQRVISLYRNGQGPQQFNGRVKYYSGVIAEVPNQANSYRYLIFFENGNVQYSNHDELRVTVSSKDQPHFYFPQSSQQFIREYFERLPERKILNVNTMDIVKIELRGKWNEARVTAIDASLMEVYYPKAQLKEWLYRGSSRMLPMSNLLTGDQRLMRNIPQHPSARAIRTTGSSPRKGRYMYSMLEDNDDDDQPTYNTTTTTVNRSVAKKSITRSSIESGPDISTAKTSAPLRDEFAGSLQTVLLPPDALQPRNLGKHTCSNVCTSWTNYSYEKTSGVNPLVIPMLFGFRRIDQQQQGNRGRHIYYQAPCGTLITDFEDLLWFNHLTKSLMPVDFFNFDPWVKLYDEFVSPSDCIIIKDMAEGKEHHPIPVVNCLDASLPPYMDYITARQATEGAPLNLDPSFLAGCDCIDDCRDQENCACFQRTLAEYYRLLMPNQVGNEDIIPQNVESIGYKHRRLLDNVLSGIYECNSQCKCCKRTCLNRVVQQRMSVKLELFKTRLKGWGTRCLNDLPAGSFVCVYIGRILNEDEANEDGRKHGDEYFAELDYIEYMETLKEGYETNATEPDSQEDDAQVRYGVFGDSSSDEEDGGSNVKTKSFGNQISPEENKKYMPHRLYYGKDEKVYIMDAKTSGNIGRYFNHSCDPNIFVQNVFVDTHDLRFPWVAFFTKRHIRAGSELTWDYQYTIGSVPGKEMYCHCLSKNCRGRLL